MPIRNVDYWREEHNKLHRRVDNDAKKLDAIYKSKLKGVNGQIEAFYKKYSVDNELTIKEAKQLLSPKEYRAFNAKLSAWIKSGKYADDKSFVASMERMRGTSKIDRLQRLKTEITANISDLKKKTAVITQDSLEDTFKETEKATGRVVQETLRQTSEAKIRAVINTEFMGRRFSPRIWTQRANLTDKLFNTLADNFVEGKNWNDLKTDLRRTFGATDHEARRLLITETARINSIAKENSYAEAGFTHYQYISVSDDRTSDVCVAHDDRIFKIEDMVVGVNAPPLHVYCRSTIVPYEMAGDEPIQIPPKVVVPPKKRVPKKPKEKPLKDMTKAELEKKIRELNNEEREGFNKYLNDRNKVDDEIEARRIAYRDKRKTLTSETALEKNRVDYKRDRTALEAKQTALDEADRKRNYEGYKVRKKYEDQLIALERKEIEAEKLRVRLEREKAKAKQLEEEKKLRSADQTEIDDFNKGFDKAPAYIRKQLDRYDKDFVGLLHLRKQGAHYNRFNAINMGTYKHTQAGGLSTWRHEYGHYLDHQLGRDGYGGASGFGSNYFSSKSRFTDAMKEDQRHLMKKAHQRRSDYDLQRSTFEKHDGIAEAFSNDDMHTLNKIEKNAYKKLGFTEKEFSEWYKYNMGGNEPFGREYERKVHLLDAMVDNDALNFFRYAIFSDIVDYADKKTVTAFYGSKKSGGSTQALSDIIGSATNNKLAGHSRVYGRYGHSTSYLKRAGARQTESFANITDLLSRNSKVDDALLNAFAPSMTKIYKEGLENAN